MGEPKAKDTLRHRGSAGMPRLRNADVIVNPYSSPSDENQTKPAEKGHVGWAAAKQDLVNKTPHEKARVSTKAQSFSHNRTASVGYAECHVISERHGQAWPLRPNPSLLSSLRSLGEHRDHMLLPQSLHRIAEAYFLEEDYQWAVQFLHLERLYHERLLSNLASLQEKWESQWKVGIHSNNNSTVAPDSVDEESEHMDFLSHICRTHQRPTLCMEKNMSDKKLMDGSKQVPEDRTVEQGISSGHSTNLENWMTGNPVLRTELQEEVWDGVNEEEVDDQDLQDLEEELQEETMEDVTSLEELTRLIQVEELFPSDGLVSILKRKASQDRPAADKTASSKSSSKRKVRFCEPGDDLDNDEVGGASCLILLLLCLVTVVISMAGTALYCLLGGSQSSVCTDFSHNKDFYVGYIQRWMNTFTQWLSPGLSELDPVVS